MIASAGTAAPLLRRAHSIPLRVPADRDPFARMLAAQAQAEDIPIFSNEVVFDRYGMRRIW
jgi:PIN domain nuclease of toxin-antitoxin system